MESILSTPLVLKVECEHARSCVNVNFELQSRHVNRAPDGHSQYGSDCGELCGLCTYALLIQ